MSSFTGSFENESRVMGSTPEFGDEDYTGDGLRHSSERFNSVSNFQGESVQEPPPDAGNDDVVSSKQEAETQSPPPGYAGGGGNGPIFASPAEMGPVEGFALREWRRLNALRLEEKEKKEKEMVRQIIEEAEQYKAEFYKKRSVIVENTKKANREKEKLFLANQEKFHSEADQNYWKATAALIPREVPAIEKRGKKDEKKKPSVVVIQGPKPGKPTDLSRMRQILLKLKHNPPPHMKVQSPPQPSAESKQDANSGSPVPRAASASGANKAA